MADPDSDKATEAGKWHPALVVGCILIGAAVLWGVYCWAVRIVLVRPGASFAEAGLFGDAFGALNAFLTACAFGAVVASYLHQRAELRTKEKEIADQKADAELARELLHKQAFEQMFFKMLENSRNHGSSVEFWRYAQVIVRHVDGLFDAAHQGPIGLSGVDQMRSYVGDHYRSKIYDLHEENIGPYFRTLYHTFKFVDSETSLAWGDKIRYANLARASLSKSELIVMAANCCNSELASPFGALVVKYRLLKHLPKGQFREMMEICFPPETFQARD